MKHAGDEDVSFYAPRFLDFRDVIYARQDLDLYLYARLPPRGYPEHCGEGQQDSLTRPVHQEQEERDALIHPVHQEQE